MDIWAVGCILYEATFGNKAFDNDFHVLQYVQDNRPSLRQLDLPFEFLEATDETEKSFISKVIHESLNVDPVQRPSSAELLKRVKRQKVEPGSSWEAAANDEEEIPRCSTIINREVTLPYIKRFLMTVLSH